MTVETIQNLGIFATGTAAAGLVVRYAIQRFSGLVEQGIERSSEAAEQGIERSFEVAEQGIEQFFETKLTQHQDELESDRVVSSRFHEERADTILELYRRFVQFERDIQALKTGMPSGSGADELLQTATKSGTRFSTYYTDNKIYFPPDTCEAVESVLAAMNDVIDDFRAGPSHDSRPEQPTDVEPGLAEWRDGTGDEVLERKCELETHFRELLGVDPDVDE